MTVRDTPSSGRGVDAAHLIGRFTEPTAAFLPASSAMVRALRPLKRKVLPWHGGEVVLDEDATAERAVQDGLWWPVVKPAETRWLDLTLVVDTGPSMALWQPAVTAFISSLQQLGAFATIQLRLLDTHRSQVGTSAEPVLHGGTPATPSRSAAELLDPSGRRIVLVLTDGIGASWRHGLTAPLLARWGAAMPLAVVHLLPQRLWARGGLVPQRATLTVPGPLRPNRRWGVTLADAWLAPDPAAAMPAGAVAVPVLELDPRWLSWWARLITGSHDGPADAMVLLTTGQTAQASPAAPAADREPAGAEPSARERVRRFHSVASPLAFRLATLLAAVPVNLPIARLIQAELVPESGPDHLAEVLTSELLQPAGQAADDQPRDAATFDIPEAVRAELVSAARRSDTARAVYVTADRFGDQIAWLTRLRDALVSPDSAPDPTPGAPHEIAIERVVLRALSGPYLSRVNRIEAIERDPRSTGAATAGPDRIGTVTTSALVSETMSDRTDLAGLPDRQPPIVPDDSPVPAVPSSDTSTSGSVASTVRPIPPPPMVSVPAQPSSSRVDVPRVWGNVPPRNPNFTGREDLLDQLAGRLAAGTTTAVLPAAVHGMGGIGKTQMAVEYVYRRLQNYDIVWWVQATQVNQIRAGLTELAQHLRLPGSEEVNTAIPAVSEALRLGHPYSRWLLIFDAAESPEVVRPFFPTNGPGEILITSRNPDWASVARPLEVTVFERAESIELLRRRGPEIDEGDAHRLAERLGDLPLAIEQAAAWRAETGMPVREYLRLFDEKVAEILDTTRPANYEVSVAAAWNVSFDELATRNPAAHQLLQVCAFFAPEPIARGLFTGVRGVSIAPELDKALREPMQLSRAVRDISRYGLAKIDHRHDALLLHRLVQLVLRNRMSPQSKAVMQHGAHQLLANADPRSPAAAKQWPQYLAVLPHVYAADLVECDDGWGRELVINLFNFLYLYGDHEEALNLAESAFRIWSERLGATDTQTLLAGERYAFYLWQLGRYTKAAELNQRIVEHRRQTSGADAEETLSMQLNITTDLKTQGRYQEAKQLSEDVLQKTMALFGPDDPTTLRAAFIHAINLRFNGEYRQALVVDEDTYRRRLEVFGYEHSNTMASFTSILLNRREAGDYAGARAGYERHADHMKRVFGGDKAGTLRVYSYLAVARRKDGDHLGALELSTEMLQRFRTRYGDQHPAGLPAFLSHSIDVRQAGDLPAARDLGEQAIDRSRELLGEHHPNTLAALLDLAVTLRQLGDTAASRQLDERTLEQFRAALGPDHPYSVVAATGLASDLAAHGETEAAATLGADALERSIRALGEDHATTLATTLNLALDLRALGRKQEAEATYADVLTRYRQVLGETHPATVEASKGIRAECDIDPLPF